jgi:hypothetical protein
LNNCQPPKRGILSRFRVVSRTIPLLGYALQGRPSRFDVMGWQTPVHPTACENIEPVTANCLTTFSIFLDIVVLRKTEFFNTDAILFVRISREGVYRNHAAREVMAEEIASRTVVESHPCAKNKRARMGHLGHF